MQFQVKNFASGGWKYAAVVLALIIAAVYFYSERGNSPDTTFTVVSGDFTQKVSVSGTVIAANDVDLGFAANGRVEGVYAKVGQKVNAGTVLAETENGDLSADLSKKRSALEEAKAKLASLLSGTRPEELAVAFASVANAKSALVDSVKSAYTTSDDAVHNKVDSFFTNPRTDPKLSFILSNSTLKNAVESERAAVESVLLKWALLTGTIIGENSADYAKKAQSYLEQVATLLADSNSALNHGIPDSVTSASMLSSYITTLATVRTSVNSAASALTTAMTALDSAEKNLALKLAGSTGEAIDAQKAAVAVAEADVDNALSALAKTYVVAPFSGTVTRMDAKIGEVVSPSMSLISVQSDGIFRIETYISEMAIADVSVGNSATTTLDAYGPSVEFPATVISVDPAETMKDGVPAYKTTLAFFASDSRIRSGMTANVVITTGILRNSIVIPSGSVGNKNGTPYVSVFSGGSVVNRAVVVGISPALGQTEILSGLSDGDAILFVPKM